MPEYPTEPSLLDPLTLSFHVQRARDSRATTAQFEELDRLAIAFRHVRVLLPIVQIKADAHLRQN